MILGRHNKNLIISILENVWGDGEHGEGGGAIC